MPGWLRLLLFLMSLASGPVGALPGDALPTPPTPTVVPFMLDLTFLDARHGWVLGADCDDAGHCTTLIRATTDGGETWRPLGAPDAAVTQIRFATLRDGWVWNAQDGGLFATHDGGTTWAPAPLPGTLAALAPAGAAVQAVTRVCPAAARGKCALTLYVSADAGRTWRPASPQPLLVGDYAQIVRAAAGTTWLLSAGDLDRDPWWAGQLRVSHDSGVTWQARVYPCGVAGGEADRLAAAPDGALWFVCAGQAGAGQAEQAKILYTSADDGRHWRRVAAYTFGQPDRPTGLPGAAIWSLAAQSGQRAWMTLAWGGLWTTANGGSTWAPAPVTFAEPTSDAGPEGPILFVDAQHGWIGGRFALFRTTDGGAHWAEAPHP